MSVRAPSGVSRSLRRRRTGVLLLACALAAPSVQASGLEIMPGGARSVGRGGAVTARPEDPMALIQNPAGLARLGDHQVYVNFDLPLHSMCVEPYGYYGWGVYSPGTSEFGDQLAVDDPRSPTPGATYASTPLPRVCNSGRAVPVPQMAWAGRVSRRWTLAAGFVAPVVVTGLQFGGPDGTLQTPYGPRPSPTRYSLVKQEVTFANAPTFGAAYAVRPGLSFGATVQILMLRARATQAQNAVSGTQPSTDWLATLTTQDFFVPSLTASVHAKPVDALDLVAVLHVTDDVHGSGDVVYETNTYHRGALDGPIPYRNDPIRLADVSVKLPWHATAGARWAGKLPDEGRRGDPMDTEQWDVEADVAYSMNRRASVSSVAVGQDATVVTRSASGAAGSNTVRLSDLSAFDIDRHLKDSVAMRVGGSYSVVPRAFAVNAGAFYETRGVELAYADITTFAFRRVGVGAGVVLRLGDLDVLAAYGRVVSETVEIAPPPHQNLEDAVAGKPTTGFDQRVGGTFGADGTRVGGAVLPDPRVPPPGGADAVASATQKSAVTTVARPERIINAGRYTASFDILSVGIAYHF